MSRLEDLRPNVAVKGILTMPGATLLTIPSPGSRVVVRDEEWLVSNGADHRTADAFSHAMASRIWSAAESALFLTELEDEIDVLDPAKTYSCRTPARPSTTLFCISKATGAAASQTTNRSTSDTGA